MVMLDSRCYGTVIANPGFELVGRLELGTMVIMIVAVLKRMDGNSNESMQGKEIIRYV